MRKIKGKEAFDLSYELHGYYIKSYPYLIEVKAFKDSINKDIQLTKSEYETMNKEENYYIYVVEDALDDILRINIINETTHLLFTKQSKTIFEIRTSSEEYSECNEDKWRNNVTISKNVQI